MDGVPDRTGHWPGSFPLCGQGWAYRHHAAGGEVSFPCSQGGHDRGPSLGGGVSVSLRLAPVLVRARHQGERRSGAYHGDSLLAHYPGGGGRSPHLCSSGAGQGLSPNRLGRVERREWTHGAGEGLSAAKPGAGGGGPMSPGLFGGLSVVVLLAVMALGVPIAVAMAAVGFVGFAILVTPEAAYQVLAKDIFSVFNSYTMGMLVMFVLMGYLAYHSGIGKQLYAFAHKTLGYLPGGVAMANHVAGGLFGAVCGSSTATCATIGSIALPEMRKFKYADSLSTASVAAAGTLAILIPPSVIFVLYGLATEQSISALFMAGIIPGIMLTALYMVAVYVSVKVWPHLAPPTPEERPKFGEIVHTLKGGLIE